MKIYDLVVVGAGPAGLAAAIYAHNVQLDVMLVAPDLGGKVASNYIMNAAAPRSLLWGSELVAEFTNQLQSQPKLYYQASVEMITRSAQGIFEITLNHQAQPLYARSLILASGVKPQRIYVPGEERDRKSVV